MDSVNMVAATGSYQLKINHLATKDMPPGEKISSPKFRVGPHDCTILFYPQCGYKNDNARHVSVYLKLQKESTNVSAKYVFAMLDKHGNVSSISSKEGSDTFTLEKPAMGFTYFLETTKLKEIYVKDGYFVLQVSIIVEDKSFTISPQNMCLRNSFKQCREENKRTDVTFDVDGKKFEAHRLIMAAQSPVFEAELYGSMAESKMKCIPIKEMEPSVFKAMLDFMYNGSLPANEKLVDGDDPTSLVFFLGSLLAAANRYAVEQLKSICEQQLQESISVDTVLYLLELAEKHLCSQLKKDCLQFIVGKNNWAYNEEYIKLMHSNPSLFNELKKMVGK